MQYLINKYLKENSLNVDIEKFYDVTIYMANFSSMSPFLLVRPHYSPTSFANGRPFALQRCEWVSWIKKAPPMFASSGDDDVDEDDDGRPRDGLPQLVSGH